jgi:phytoene synthase
LIKNLSTSLGVAMQVTNILRDIRDDALVDRLYIPKEFLQKAGIKTSEPKEVVINKNLSVAREELAKIATQNYEKSFELIGKLDKKISRSIKALAYVYKRYFDIMQNRGWEIISPKPSLNCFVKMYLVFKAYIGR